MQELDLLQNQIKQTYKLRFSDLGWAEFDSYVLPQLISVSTHLGNADTDDIFNLANDIIDFAGQFDSNIEDFWKDVNSATFTIPYIFSDLNSSAVSSSTAMALHLGRRDVIEALHQNGEMLLPPYIRNNEQYDPEDEVIETNHYNTYFASGNLVRAAQFLIGFNMLNNVENYDANNVGKRKWMGKDFAIAIADVDNSMRAGLHSIDSIYNPFNSEHLPIFMTRSGVQVKDVIKIFQVALFPNQIDQFRTEAAEIFYARIAEDKYESDATYLNKFGLGKFTEVYIEAKRAELALVYELLGIN